MNDCERATFLRRLGALLIDAAVVLFLGAMYFTAWAFATLGGVPETASEYTTALEAGEALTPSFLAEALAAYVILSLTPILGRRTVGMRQVGIRVVRDRQLGR